MIIAPTIKIDSNKLSSGLSEAIKLCRAISNNPNDEYITIDFKQTQFVTPTFIIPLLIYLNKTYAPHIEFKNLNTYMYSICLHTSGVDFGDMRKVEILNFLENYTNKSYLPIIEFPTYYSRIEDKGYIISTIETILGKQSKLRDNIIHGIKYMLGEITDNITEHSQSPCGYILAQSYPNLGYIDVCIGDKGVTLLGSYNTVRNDITNDIDAMRAAQSGVSAKNLPQTENRGYGISTTKRMLVQGMGGQYMIVSGSVVYVYTKAGTGFFELPFGIRFNGTITALRIPCMNDKFQYGNYFE